MKLKYMQVNLAIECLKMRLLSVYIKHNTADEPLRAGLR
jgi:hypothetical protein